MRNRKLLWGSIAALAAALFYFSGIAVFSVKAGKGVETNTPQPLPFSQNWTNAGLITANDDWSGVPGIVGFLGNYDTVNAPTNVDPRTLLTPFVTNDADVIANQNSVALTNGGVAEFDGIANPVVALNGSGTADAPHIIVYVNTTGATNINFTCNIRDIDDTIDNSAQQVDVQYRVGGTGNYVSVTGGYIADASSGPSTTMTTPLNVTLPTDANNQAMVEVRVMTTNAGGNDEWIGVDDISVTGTVAPVNQQHVVDFNGDGKTDWAIVRNVSGQWNWIIQENSVAAPITYQPFGITNTDILVPEDYDGDNKTDIAVWRDSPADQVAFYILQSQSSTVRAELFGQGGDNPTVVGDYDGDGKADLAVVRSSGGLKTWFYRTTAGGPIFARQWGITADFVAPGDYDGDGKFDFAVQRPTGIPNQAAFWMNYAAAAPGVLSRYAVFGGNFDIIVPGDYDGDGKTDIAIVREVGATLEWYYEPSTAPGTFLGGTWGLNASDITAQGDYDGDGKTDFAVWRENVDPTQNFFLIRKSSDGALLFNEWGSFGDTPAASYNRH